MERTERFMIRLINQWLKLPGESKRVHCPFAGWQDWLDDSEDRPCFTICAKYFPASFVIFKDATRRKACPCAEYGLTHVLSVIPLIISDLERSLYAN